MFKNILICSDGSDDALHAARFVAPIARPLEATLTVLNVFNHTAATSPFSGARKTVPCAQKALEYGEQAQRDILARTGAVLTEAGAACRTRGERGHPIDTIVRIAEEDKSDLIVLGSHGWSDIERLLLGSVSHGVARYAPCPVLVVRGQTPGLQRIVAAFDGSEQSCDAVRVAATLAGRLHSSLTVLNVVEPGKPTMGISPQVSGIDSQDIDPAASMLRLEQTAMHRVEEELQKARTDYRFWREQGHPAEAIALFAEANHTDLIVIGSRGLGGFKRLLLGSISDAVLHHAPCPVLIVR